MRTRILGVLLAIGLLATAACGHPHRIHSGLVVGKSYDDPDDTLVPIINSCGNGCSFTTWVNIHDGPHWYLRIEGSYVNDKKETKTTEEAFSVDETTFSNFEHGDCWSDGSEVSNCEGKR